MGILLLTSAVVLALTCSAFVAYEFITFRHTTRTNLATLGRVIASNSTASLAFRNENDATEILSALRAEPHVVAAALYDRTGRLFARYPDSLPPSKLPSAPGPDGYRFEHSALIGFEPVAQPGSRRLGTLYLESDLNGVYGTLEIALLTAVLVLVVSLLVAYALSNALQATVSGPILELARTASNIADQHDYSVRAPRVPGAELGLLTDAFNQMLGRIEEQDSALRAAVQAREVFIGVASHELRTPLTALLLQLANLRWTIESGADSPAPLEKLSRHLTVVERQADRLTQLVESLLDVSRAMAGRFELSLEELDLAEIVRESVARFAPQASKAGCPLLVQLDQPCPGRWDRLRVEQVLGNLLVNAVKFGPGKPIHVVLACEPTVATLSVRDEGVGIAKDDQGRIFERFEQGRTPRPFGGLGLGLWIARQIVLAMEGTIAVRSEQGQGSEFTIVLPRRARSPDAPSPAA